MHGHRVGVGMVMMMSLVGCATGSDLEGDDTVEDEIVESCGELPDTCSGEGICVDGRCEEALPHAYAMTYVAVSIPPLNPSTGQPWDAGGRPPHLGLRVGGIAYEPSSPDGFVAAFDGPIRFGIDRGTPMPIEVFEHDEPTEELVLRCEVAPNVAMLRTRAFECSVGDITLTAVLEPS